MLRVAVVREGFMHFECLYLKELDQIQFKIQPQHALDWL